MGLQSVKKLAIIGASELQNPLIVKAHEMGVETHVYAWEAGDIGERTADVFHPISIIEKEEILASCRSVGIDGVCTIASDLANVTVGYIAHELNLPGNDLRCTAQSTDKHLMRQCFEQHGDPSPRSESVHPGDSIDLSDWTFPLIVKPIDRSGSRGVTKLETADGLDQALSAAFDAGFEKTALIEEFAEGDEFSVEYFSWQGNHTFCALTRKFTTGAPHFIERGHCEPAGVDQVTLQHIKDVVSHALDSLGVEQGTSHSEVKVDAQGNVRIIEIGSRMGGDCIGSDLVPLTTGIDLLAATVDAALGRAPQLAGHATGMQAAVRYLFDDRDLAILERAQRDHPNWIVRVSNIADENGAVADSSQRIGFFVVAAPKLDLHELQLSL
ncbi:MAG: ATP-grasp domain-containing protein [Eggerthellaceae bacterium]|jgi:biotin carboxylase|nr:ATP-grasp domain-containing protein [Eggerthellaceae bacterium]MCH4220562.1 ATP-grasp domain-containing protein [Eggerthellaceae bacterium]